MAVARTNSTLFLGIRTIVTVATCVFVLVWAGGSRGLAGTCPEVDFEGFDLPPALIEGPTATVVHLHVARMARLSGEVAMRVWVLSDGKVCDVEVLSAPHALLSNSAKRAVVRSTYSPALLDSVPVPGIAHCSYLFEFLHPGIKDKVFGANLASPFISDLVELGSAELKNRGDTEYIEFEGVEIRGDLPLEVFQSIQRQIKEVGPDGEDLYAVEVMSVAYRESAKSVVYRPAISLYFCAQRLAGDRCTKSTVVEVVQRHEGYELGRRNTLFSDYLAK